jgi:hypothetical protein
MFLLENYLNRKFGKLTVLYLDYTTKTFKKFLKCKCDCGREAIVEAWHLRAGNTKSCGCLIRGRLGSYSFNGYGEIKFSHWKTIKKWADIRSLEFNITIGQAWDLFLKQDRKCVLSGVKLTFQRNSGDESTTASLDRIDSSKGYTIDNIQWVHKWVNIMKQDMLDEEFIDWCKLIANNNR